jgi:bacterioferritin (cytochrome b1)
MPDIKEDLVRMLNRGLELEHAARIQYLAHAELIKGPGAEPIISRIKEIAGDEARHEEMFRSLIGSYLGGEPTMSMSETHRATTTDDILETNRRIEKTSVDFYKEIYQKVTQNKSQLQYEFERLEHDIRHIILDEQEHISELSLLLEKEMAYAK